MNRCPSCRNLVPAGWIACRRCGAALSASRPAAAFVRPALVALPVGHDNLLPRATLDNLLPYTRRRWRPERMHVVIAISVLAVVLTAYTASRVMLSGSTATTAATVTSDGTARTEQLLHVATETARMVYIQRGSTYASMTPAALAAHLHGVTVVAAGTVAQPDQVSVRPDGANMLVLASPATTGVCVFVRDEPTRSRVESVTTHGVTCSAASAPKTGWSIS